MTAPCHWARRITVATLVFMLAVTSSLVVLSSAQADTDQLNTWQLMMDGLPYGQIKQVPFVRGDDLYIAIPISKKSDRFPQGGLYRLDQNTDTWEQISSSVPHYARDFVIDDAGNWYTTHHGHKKWIARVFVLPTGSDTWEQLAELDARDEVDSFSHNDIELIDGTIYLKATKGKKKDAVHKIMAFDIETKEIASVGYPPFGSGRNHFGYDRDGNLIMSDQYGGKKNQGTYTYDEGGMWRYTPTAGTWEDITRNLDQRNSTNGKCCAGLGGNSQGVTYSADGEQVYTRTEHGLYRWNYDADNWDKLFDAPYGSGAGFISPVDADSVIFDERYMQGYEYQVMGEGNGEGKRNKSVFRADGSTWDDENTRTELQSMYSFDGETFYGRFRVMERGDKVTKGKKAGQYKWNKKNNIFAKLTRDPDAPRVTFDFSPDYASYLGGTADDVAVAAEVTAAREIVVAGNFTNDSGQTTGQLRVYDATGSQLLHAVDLGSRVYDMELNPTDGSIAIITDDGASLLDANLNLLWTTAVDLSGVDGSDLNPARISIGTAGTVAVLAKKTITTFAPDGTEFESKRIGKSYVTDLAVRDEEGSVFVGGFSNNRGTANGKSNPVQIAFLHGYDTATLVRTQTTWDYDADTLAETHNMADTRIYRVNTGKDGKLYVVGESAGGNTIYRWNGLDLGTSRLVTSDPYNHAWNTGSAHIGYVGRIDPTTGEAESGQMILARLLSNNKGNTFRARSITADEGGNVYIGGTSACCSVARQIRRIGGEPMGDYKGGESSLLVLSNNFKDRLLWTPLLSPDADASDNGVISAIAVGYGVKALVGNADSGLVYTTPGAAEGSPWNPEKTPKGQHKVRDSYIMTWGADMDRAPVADHSSAVPAASHPLSETVQAPVSTIVAEEDMGSIDTAVVDTPQASAVSPAPATQAVHMSETVSDADYFGFQYSSVAIDHNWQQVEVAFDIPDPVVIAGVPTRRGSDPGVVRVRDVAPDTVQVRFQEWDYLDGRHTFENAGVGIFQRGRHTLADGTEIEVGTFTLGDTQAFMQVDFSRAFDRAPHLFLTSQTYTGTQPITVRAQGVDTAGFQAALFEEEALNDGHLDETIGYLAIVPPAGGASGTIVGNAYSIDTLRIDGSSRDSVVQLEEEQSRDAERDHVTETVHVLRLGDVLFGQIVSFEGGDTVSLRQQ